MDKFDKIYNKLKDRKINSEQALEDLTKIGYCPNLFNDDNGHWAVKFDGIQTAPTGDDTEDVISTCFIEKDFWKDSIHDALLYAMKEE